VLAMTGAGVAANQIGASPTSVNFGNVMVGNSQTSPATLTNIGSGGVTISQTALSNSAYAISGLPLPVTLNAGQSLTFNVIFTPQASGSSSGNLAVFSDAGNGQLNIGLAGAGVDPGQLALAPSAYDFGNTDIGKNSSTTGALTAVGSAVTLSSASSDSSEFVLSGITLPLTIADGQSIPFTVTFLPQASGVATGNISFVSNAKNSLATETLSGNGVAPTSHSVDLSWNASGTPGVVGYHVYRSSAHGGPYGKLNATADPQLIFCDETVQSGQTYYYVITAEDTGGMESGYSNEAKVIVPSP